MTANVRNPPLSPKGGVGGIFQGWGGSKFEGKRHPYLDHRMPRAFASSFISVYSLTHIALNSAGPK
jgi:hypothetical protein